MSTAARTRQGAPAGPVPAQLEACLGRHLGTPLKGAVRLQWMPMAPPIERARVVAHTCERCRPIWYELLNLGGAFLIRRYQRKPGGPVVHETARVRKRLAEEWWQALRHGAAC